MKKYLGKLLLILVMILFMQPITEAKFSMCSMNEVGSVGGSPIGGVYMSGELSNNGTPYIDHRGKLVKDGYDTGIATFGNSRMPLYYYYNCDYEKGHEYYELHGNLWGSRNKEWTVPLEIQEGMSCIIYEVKNNRGMIMYMLEHSGPVAGTTTYILMGMREDGKILKYIDTAVLLKNYFGINKRQIGPWFKDASVNGDTVTIKYEHRVYNPNKRKSFTKYGEFSFKWDENAQWFSVEHRAY